MAALEPSSPLALVHVFTLFRHGDRSPITRRVSSKLRMTQQQTDLWASSLPDLSVVAALNSGSRVVDYHDGDCGGNADCCAQPPPPQQGGRWPCGQLTAKGVDMMRVKGEALRRQYKQFLEPVEPSQVHAQSTNIRRTIRSAQSLLAGLFPEHFEHVDNRLSQSNLLPDSRRFLESLDRVRRKEGVFVIHADDSNSLAPQHSYELYRELGKMLADELKKHAPPGFDVASQRLSRIVGEESGKRLAWTGLREVLVCHQAHGLAFPDGLDEQLFAQVCEYDAWLWHHLYGKLAFCRASFKAGVERVYSYLNGIIEGTITHKLSLFSAHDNSLVAFVNALQLQVPPVIPPYGAMLIFEVYRDSVTGEFYLRALFEGNEVTFASYAHSALCPFSVFQQAAQSFLYPNAAL